MVVTWVNKKALLTLVPNKPYVRKAGPKPSRFLLRAN
jgi:hypothetical protein